MAKKTSISKLLFAESLAEKITPDWRYELVLPYVQHSTSYQAVRDKHRGLKVAANELPRDEHVVRHVANWLGLLSKGSKTNLSIQEEWLKHAKSNLYGFHKPIPSVGHTFTVANESSVLTSEDLEYPCIMLRVPLTLTMSEALAQIRSIFNLHVEDHGAQFGTPIPDSYKGQYKLQDSRLRRATLIKGVEALTMYKAGAPLWKIGNDLNLSPDNAIDVHDTSLDQDIAADRKRVLSIMAHRLVKTAALVAENAARGRFPSDENFPEAIVSTFTRKAGRPVGSKRPKRLNVR